MEHENGTATGTSGGNGESGGTLRGGSNGYDKLSDGSLSLLDRLRGTGEQGTPRDAGTPSRPASESARRASLSPRAGKQRDTGDHATSTRDDSANRRAVSENARGSGQDGSSNRGASESTSESKRTNSRPGRPAKGLNPKPIEQKTVKKQSRQLKLPWQDTAPLSLDEATGAKPMMVNALKKFWQGTDDFISATNRQKAEAIIWQLIDDEDTEYLVDRLLGAGMVSRPVAAAVRGIARSYHLLNTGMILLPRFMASVQFYSQHGGFSLGGAM